jgi:hypothetical protein
MEGRMRYPLRVCGIVVLLCLVLSCAGTELRKARSGAEASVAQLPDLAGFDRIKTVFREYPFTAYGDTCYYGTAHVIIGSSHSEADALDVYSRRLAVHGWVPEGKQYDDTRTLIRGAHERIVVRFGEPGVEIKDAVDYAQLRANYVSVVFVRLVFILPRRDGC